MEFINYSGEVSDVTIPEGNCVKIEEAATGRVLWEKKVEEVTPQDKAMFIEQYSSSTGQTCYSHCFYRVANSTSITTSNLPNSSSYGIGNYWRLAGGLVVNASHPWEIGTGSTFKLYSTLWHNTTTDKTTWHEVTDGIWTVTPVHVWASTTSGAWADGSSECGPLELNISPITLSPSTGAQVSLSRITNFQTFVSRFESSSFGSQYPKAQYPNIRVEFALKVSSPSLGIEAPDINLRMSVTSVKIAYHTAR